MSIVTKGGDSGETSLLYGGRVPKDDLHTEAYGALDEAISAMGLARSLCQNQAVVSTLLDLERECFTAGSELATASADRDKLLKHFPPLGPEAVDRLEALVHELELEVGLPPGFILPGGTPGAAAIDLARTLVRRAERRAVALRRADELANQEVVRYLNRLSDLLFMLARQEEAGRTTLK
ncbi:MAG TPA: cob(I)yrinic acid a,c-diamide adenosyltransferase [Candidatus Nanopelagicaceae bacterium]|nr:cob(I)yrinic acid a,c-diamide adenosyltransferase [Candidatus Nanopelagicaceae bacterium]